MIMLIMALGTAACYLLPEQLIGLFTENADTILIGRTALRIISLGFVVSSVSVNCSGTLEALGEGVASLTISLLRYIVVIIPAAYLLSRHMEASGVWWAFVLTEVVAACVAALVFRRIWRGKRKKYTV